MHLDQVFSMRSLFLKIFLWFWGAMALTVIAFTTVVANTQPQNEETDTAWNSLIPSLSRDHSGPSSASGMGQSGRRGNGHDDHGERGGHGGRGGPGEMVRIAAAVMDAGGLSATTRYLDRLEKTDPARAIIFDTRGEGVVRRPTSPWPQGLEPVGVENRLRVLARRASQSGDLELPAPGPVMVAAQSVMAPEEAGQRTGYVVAIARPDDRERSGRGGPGRILDWLLFAPLNTQLVRLGAALLTTGLVCFLLARHLTSPLLHLRSATHALAAGDLSARVGNSLPERADEFGVLARDFDAMAARLETLVSAQNRLVADISHELRSPLARLSVALGLVRETAGPDAGEDLDRIEREAERLNALIGQLLTLSRLESGEQKPGRESVDLGTLLQEICADAEFEARARGGGVDLRVEAPCRVVGSPLLLRSALENVVRNATRYARDGTRVEVALFVAGDEAIPPVRGGLAEVQVRDHGPGVPDEALPYLFRPFYRVEGARDRQSGGAGLGLAITQAAIELHGGTVFAANSPGGGLLIEIRIPLPEA